MFQKSICTDFDKTYSSRYLYFLLSSNSFPFLFFERLGDKGIPDDELYHHFCFTWSNDNGDYKFWLDGEVVGSGSDFQTGTMIDYGGIAVVGQDQDSFGGGFHPSQSWAGEVSGLNVWGEVRSDTDIKAEFQECHVTTGSIIEWPQLYAKDSLHGNVCVFP